MKDQLESIKKDFSTAIEKVKSLADLADLENKFLGRKNGALTLAMKELKNLPKSKIAEAGQAANEIKKNIELKIKSLKAELSQTGSDGFFDYTLPGQESPLGHLHLVTEAIREIAAIFERVGFERMRYPEVEWDYYAFESLNMPKDHPARDEWETFFIDKSPISKKFGLPAKASATAGQRVLTPHTSNGQVRDMERGKLPIRMMNISKTYRRQMDASHTPMFHQFEGLVIDKDINITHLKGTIDYFVKNFFLPAGEAGGPDREIRLRPHHFQFTEPSFEIDVSCGVCGGKGCKLCKEGWLELAGAGMVHPNVLKAGGIDPNKYSGFAFGWGVERCYMMKSGLNIDDIRLLYKNDLRFLRQF
ncbi:MAG: phenylalanine--tRNA ligase subunit alpha [Patescibacteria group bacterium]